MRSFVLPVLMLLAAATVGVAQVPPALKGPPPMFWIASAAEKDGAVVVKVSMLVPTTMTRQKIVDGKPVN